MTRIYCMIPEHKDGEHGPECIPPAEPGNPELRLIRAIWGLCPDCDRTGDHTHPGYAAVMNTPGYLPWDDEPPVFEQPGDAWSWLANERRDAEDVIPGDGYSDTVDQLDAYASANHGPDTVYGSTPGYDGEHDLGIAYSVEEIP